MSAAVRMRIKFWRVQPGSNLPRPIILQQHRTSIKPCRIYSKDTSPSNVSRRTYYSVSQAYVQSLPPHPKTALKMENQAVDGPLTSSATIIVASVTQEPNSIATIRKVLSQVDSITKSVSTQDSVANTSCVIGVGSSIWDQLIGLPRPTELHPFPEVRGAKHTAVSTPGDLLFHIRSERRDLCFEVEKQLIAQLGNTVLIEDTTIGFRYFDARDLLGFVDGTANPVGADVQDTVLVTESDDSAAAGGSYIVVQKYLHDLKSWELLSTEQQEAIVGRTKADDVELEDVEEGNQQAHKTLAAVKDEHGQEHEILRDNMPFGSPSSGEFGTYFIGYSRKLWVIENMMERMFVGNPSGLHDRILDYSTPITGSTFFAPPTKVLRQLQH